MTREPLRSLDCRLVQCERLSVVGGAREATELFRQLGGVFLDLGSLQPHPDPVEMIHEDGSIIGGLYLQHHTLVADVETALWRSWKNLPSGSPHAWGNFGYFPSSRSVCLGQDADPTNELGVKPDLVALGLLKFLLFGKDHLRPRYGWVDEMGDNAPSQESIDQHRLEYLFWANLFGPELTRALGRDLFDGLPGGTVVDLDNGGILYLATESFLDWRENEHPEILAPFRRRFPRIRPYRAEFVPPG
jgi:hypothetical protein